MKNILLIATGGTIASEKTGAGLSPSISSEELIRFVPASREFCNVEGIELLSLDSTNIKPEHWQQITKTIEENYEDYDGFVISHGTDTMAYTSAALSYLIQHSYKPIVITGSQKPINSDVSDAKINLLDSLIFASCDKAHGVNVVFGGKVIAGTRAKKERTKSYEAFSSINFPYLAIIQDQKVIFYLDDKPQDKTSPVFFQALHPDIFLLKLTPVTKASVIHDLQKDYDALIIESFGTGGLPREDISACDFHKAVEEWIQQGKIVVMATQVSREGSDMAVYEVGKTMKHKFGLMETYDMTLEACLTKLMWILAQIKEPEKIRSLFYKSINRDILFHISDENA